LLPTTADICVVGAGGGFGKDAEFAFKRFYELCYAFFSFFGFLLIK